MTFGRLRLDKLRQVGFWGTDQLNQCGQEPRQRFARTGRGDEQDAAPGHSGGEHVELVAARRPAALGEPVGDPGREGVAGSGRFS